MAKKHENKPADEQPPADPVLTEMEPQAHGGVSPDPDAPAPEGPRNEPVMSDADPRPEPQMTKAKAEQAAGRDPEDSDLDTGADPSMATLTGPIQRTEAPDDSDTTEPHEMDSAAQDAVGAEESPEDKAHREYLASLSISPETTRMDVEPDNPNVSYRTIQYEGRALRINAGKNVEVSLTFASILGNAANPIRTEQMRAGADAGVVITDLR